MVRSSYFDFSNREIHEYAYRYSLFLTPNNINHYSHGLHPPLTLLSSRILLNPSITSILLNPLIIPFFLPTQCNNLFKNILVFFFQFKLLIEFLKSSNILCMCMFCSSSDEKPMPSSLSLLINNVDHAVAHSLVVRFQLKYSRVGGLTMILGKLRLSNSSV